jgi:hypothetical protein
VKRAITAGSFNEQTAICAGTTVYETLIERILKIFATRHPVLSIRESSKYDPFRRNGFPQNMTRFVETGFRRFTLPFWWGLFGEMARFVETAFRRLTSPFGRGLFGENARFLETA